MNELCRFDLRTTDAVAAGESYATLLGHDRSNIWPLHQQALARGARPHWLGRLAVDDVERKAAALVKRGATQFGPMRPTADGGHAVVLRDPGGAIVAVGTPPSTPMHVDVVWHVLNTNDAARACATYHELFGVGDCGRDRPRRAIKLAAHSRLTVCTSTRSPRTSDSCSASYGCISTRVSR